MKNKIIEALIDNCKMQICDHGQIKYIFNEKQFGDLVEDLQVILKQCEE